MPGLTSMPNRTNAPDRTEDDPSTNCFEDHPHRVTTPHQPVGPVGGTSARHAGQRQTRPSSTNQIEHHQTGRKQGSSTIAAPSWRTF